MVEERFFESLEAQAEEERRRLAAEAERAAGEILEEAREESIRKRDERFLRVRAEVRSAEAKILNSARLDARKMSLRAVHRLSEEALEFLAKEVEQLHLREDYARILERLFEECTIPCGARITCRRSDRALLEAIARRRGHSPRFEEGEIPLGGFTVLSADGRFVQSNTFEDRIRRARPRLLMALARRLLPEGRKEGPEDG